jgi:FixJ family two-component response regulator
MNDREAIKVMITFSNRPSNKQVGSELGISAITGKADRGQVMRRMKADSLLTW